MAEDHDLLIELKTEMKEVRKDIKELKDGLSLRVNDHEQRLRTLEKEKGKTSMKWLEKIIGVAIAAGVSYFISQSNK